MILGFTGTRDGMSPMQLLQVARIITEQVVEAVHVGDCIGSDAQFYELIQMANKNKHFSHIQTIGHPPTNPEHRAFCKYDIEHELLPYLERNKKIVESSDILIATPKEIVEQVKSGTWSTIRYARKLDKHIKIVYINGVVDDNKI